MKKKALLCILMTLFLSLIIGWIIRYSLPTVFSASWQVIIAAAACGILCGFILNKIMLKFIDYVRKENFTHLMLLVICFIISSICGGLLSLPLIGISGWPGRLGAILVIILVFTFNGIMLSFRKDAFCDFINRVTNGKIQFSEISAHHEQTVLLDTSVIIDGRIADIAHCGFIPGTLLVPNFILQELQFIADSEDAQRRQRGRRGLETLAIMQKDKSINIRISDFDVPNVREADSKLMAGALELGCPILTNDYNLNKVAELQGIRILNVNDLTNAVKSILLPGEKLVVNVIQEGKEINQGVGYMEDGTMVVIENGRAFLGQVIDVVVTKILQTAAGRMIFARHEKDLGVKR